MKVIKSALLLLFAIAASLLSLCWHAILFLIDIIDGDEEMPSPSTTENSVRYNHRTGELDPIKRIDGLYDNEQ